MFLDFFNGKDLIGVMLWCNVHVRIYVRPYRNAPQNAVVPISANFCSQMHVVKVRSPTNFEPNRLRA